MENFPPFQFLRFDAIELITSWSDEEDEKAWDTQSIDAKCQFVEDQLKLIDPEILNDSILCFDGDVDENDSSRFSDHSELLNYLSDRILPICAKPRGYQFIFGLYSDKSAGKCVLISLLKMAQIKCCSKFRIIIWANQMKLPVKEISNWLHRNCDSNRARSLSIFLDKIENLLMLNDLFNHLKEVIFCYFAKCLLVFSQFLNIKFY